MYISVDGQYTIPQLYIHITHPEYRRTSSSIHILYEHAIFMCQFLWMCHTQTTNKKQQQKTTTQPDNNNVRQLICNSQHKQRKIKITQKKKNKKVFPTKIRKHCQNDNHIKVERSHPYTPQLFLYVSPAPTFIRT